jgi:hypothetical protein
MPTERGSGCCAGRSGSTWCADAYRLIHTTMTRRMTQIRFRAAVPFGLLLLAVAGCGDRDAAPDAAAAGDTANVQSQEPEAEPPPPGGFEATGDRPAGTLGDPSEGAQVVATMSEWSIVLNRDTVPSGAVTIAVANEGTVPHALEVTGEFGGRWRSLPVAPGATIRMSMPMSHGTYQIFCPLDNDAGDHSERGEEGTLVVR